MKSHRLPILAVLFIALGLSAKAQSASLQILNPATLGSTLSFTAGQSFNAEIFVSALPTPLDSFNLTFASLPSGLTLNGFTDTVPSGWLPFSSVAGLQYGGVNFSGSDITPSGELVLASFTSSSSMPSENVSLTFAPMGSLQNLNDSGGNTIAYTPQALNLVVTASPEPSSWILLGLGAVALRLALRKTKVPGEFRPDPDH